MEKVILNDEINNFFYNSNICILQLVGVSGSGKTSFCKKFVHQKPDILYYDTKYGVFKSTIKSNLLLGRSIEADILNIALERILPDLSDRINDECSEGDLSTGQIQRINFARNLIGDKGRKIIFDEPLSNIDDMNFQQCLLAAEEICYKLQQKILIITHTVSKKFSRVEMKT